MGKKKKKNWKPGSGSSPCLAQRQPPNRPRLTILQADVPGEVLGEQLKSVRLALGLTLADVAKEIKENIFAVYQIEANSRRKPRTELLKKLSDLYNYRVGIFVKTMGLKIRPIIQP